MKGEPDTLAGHVEGATRAEIIAKALTLAAMYFENPDVRVQLREEACEVLQRTADGAIVTATFSWVAEIVESS